MQIPTKAAANKPSVGGQDVDVLGKLGRPVSGIMMVLAGTITRQQLRQWPGFTFYLIKIDKQLHYFTTNC